MRLASWLISFSVTLSQAFRSLAALSVDDTARRAQLTSGSWPGLGQRGSNRTLVFVIGMNMQGTGSLWQWCHAHGIPALHWGALLSNGSTVRIAEAMLANRQAGRPLVAGLPELLPNLGAADRGTHGALLDMEVIDREGRFLVEAYKLFREASFFEWPSRWGARRGEGGGGSNGPVQKSA